MDTSSKRSLDIWSTLIILAAIILSASRLVITNWTSNLDIILNLTIMGAVLGIALGQSKFSSNLVRVMALAYTLFVIPWIFGSALMPSVEWRDRLASLATRLNMSAVQWLHNHTVPDPILFLFLMALLYWIIAIVATYMVSRYESIWAAIIPAGVVMLFINHYDIRTVGDQLVIYFMLCALLLIGRLTYLHHRAEWQKSGIFIMHETGADIGRATIIAGVALVLIVFSIPVSKSDISQLGKTWDTVAKPWNTVRQRFSNAFSSLKSSNPVIQTVTYGDQLSLGTTISQSQQIVFTVIPTEPLSFGARFYWKARSYDTYEDGNWSSTITSTKDFNSSNFNLTYPGSISNSGRTEDQVTFYPNTPQQDILYTSGEPLFVDHASQAILSFLPDGNVDLEVLMATPPVNPGENYRERVSVSRPTVEQMQTSSTTYPAWLTTRYLQIPKGFPTNIKALAEQVTAGKTNPYDKAEAITEYLRAAIQYNGSIPVPPSSEDPLEWFLFELKEGYCNYYASAEVMMLRSLGIPARLAVGYAQGEYDAQTDVYTVRQKDAHAWPEVYFNGVGWVEFEPTASQPARDWLTSNQSASGQNQGNNYDTLRQTLEANPRSSVPLQIPAAATPGSSQFLFGFWFYLGTALFIFAVSFIIWRFILPPFKRVPLPFRVERFMRKRGWFVPRWLHNWSLYSMQTPFERAYRAIGQAIRLLGQKPDVAQTPSERVLTLTQLLPEAAMPANSFLTEYQRDQYSPYPGDLIRVRMAIQTIRRAVYKAYLARLFNRQRASR